MKKKAKYRTLFISDVHMGTKISRTSELLDFLKNIKVEKIYLVGDIIDVSGLRRKFYWDSNHNAIIRRLIKLSKRGIKIIYIPGNHDADIKDFSGLDFAGITILKQDIHKTAANKKLLIVHGDEFDGVLRTEMFFLYNIGDRSYDMAVALSNVLSRIMKIFGKNWSLSQYLKSKVKNVVKFLNNFELMLVQKARHFKVDGIVCGHIHTAELKTIDGIIYANCGCWTESCNAVVETMDGEMKVLNIKK